MDYSKAALVVCLTLFLVIGFNLVIYFQFRRKGNQNVSTIDYLQRAAKRARNPWEQEDASLRELAERVSKLKSSVNNNHSDPTP